LESCLEFCCGEQDETANAARALVHAVKMAGRGKMKQPDQDLRDQVPRDK
jgi:hypothetical protein